MTILSTNLSQNTENFIDTMAADQAAANELKTLLRLLNQQKTDAAATTRLGTAVGTGNVASERGNGIVQQTTLTFTDMAVAVPVANKYGSQEIYDFPTGRILVHGVVSNLQWAVTTNRTTTIINSAGLAYGAGSAAATNVSLTSTMVDLHPSTSKTLSAAAAAYNTATIGALAAAAQFDGTSSAKKAFLNVGFGTGTDVLADGTLTVKGTIAFTWTNLGP